MRCHDFTEWTLQDQRNHGQRTVDKRGNQGWSRKPEEHNERHAQVSADLSGSESRAIRSFPIVSEMFADFDILSHRTLHSIDMYGMLSEGNLSHAICLA